MTPNTGKPKAERNLTRILTLSFLALSLAIMLVSSGLQLFFHFQTATRGLHHNQMLIAQGARQAVADFIVSRIHLLTTAGGVSNPDTMTMADWQLVLQRLLGMETAFRSLTLATLAGERLAFVHRFAPTHAGLKAYDPESGPPFALVDLSPYVGEIYIDPQTSEPMTLLRVTVFNALKEPRATLTAELNLKFMWQLVDRLQVSRTGYAYVADQKGYLIAFGDTARVLMGENVAHLPVVADFIEGSNGPGEDRSRVYKGLMDRFVVGTAVPLGISPWVLVTEIPWQEAYGDVLATLAASVVILLLMAGPAALLGSVLARRLAGPLSDLAQTATRIARGERELQASVSGPAEVARLAEAFNSMAAQLVGSLATVEAQFRQTARARDALQESETRLRLAQEGTTDGIWDWHLKTDQAYFSSRMYHILGYEPSEFEVSVDRWRALIHPEDFEMVTTVFGEAAASGEPFAVEFRMKSKEGQWRWVLSRGKVVETAADGRAVRLAGSLSDINQRKQAELERADMEAKFLQAQRLESIGRLAGGVAHDFNNMLSVILGRAELALMNLSPGDPFHTDFTEILTIGRRSAALTRQLLGFARKQTIAPRRIDLNQAIDAMLGLLRRLAGENIDLLWKPASDLWPIKMDPAQLDQLMTNLMVNARDAIADIGKVTLETGNTSIDEAYCKNNPGFWPGDFATLIVSDNGCGIDRASLDLIFEPFFTTKQPGHGTGLGLATVYGIVKQNQGFINAYSEIGKGTIFKLYFPRHRAADAPAGRTEPRGTPRGGHETILLVEDEKELLEITTKMLGQLGYRVLPANGPREALQMAETHRGEIQLLMTDVIMPEMNGRELQKQISARCPRMHALFMSGYTANVIVHQGILEQGLHFIGKPFSMHLLATKLRAILDGAHAPEH